MSSGLSRRRPRRQRGFSLVEILVVVFIAFVVAALSSPFIMQVVYDLRLTSAAAELSGLMQQARIMAAKNNASPGNPGSPSYYAIRYATTDGKQIAFIDLNGNGVLDASVTVNGLAMPEPQIMFGGTVVMAPGAPTGANGDPPAYGLVGDASTGAVNTNGNVLGFSQRGLPCNNDNPAACTTPAASYFVYYLTDARFGRPGWAAVVVTKSGRTRLVKWSGTAWN